MTFESWQGLSWRKSLPNSVAMACCTYTKRAAPMTVFSDLVIGMTLRTVCLKPVRADSASKILLPRDSFKMFRIDTKPNTAKMIPVQFVPRSSIQECMSMDVATGGQAKVAIAAVGSSPNPNPVTIRPTRINVRPPALFRGSKDSGQVSPGYWITRGLKILRHLEPNLSGVIGQDVSKASLPFYFNIDWDKELADVQRGMVT